MPLKGDYAPSADEEMADQIREIESSGGADGLLFEGAPVVIISSRGARSGALRKNLVIRVEHEGRYAAVASRGGNPRHPAWYRNLLAHPRCELQDAAQRRSYVARELAGEERAEWWARGAAAWPVFDDFAQAAGRMIPVLLLEPLKPDLDRDDTVRLLPSKGDRDAQTQ